MTEAELLAASSACWSNCIALVAIYVSILSGYLIVAKIAGKSMTRSQIVIVNIIYVGLTTFLIIAEASFTIAAIDMDRLAIELTTQRSEAFYSYSFLAHVLTIFYFICALASLKFMWDVRHPKTE